MSLRVFQGVTGQAGQPGSLARGFRAMGVEAKSGSIHDHKFGYKDDFSVRLDDADSLEAIFTSILPIADQFDIFHFHARSFSSNWPYQLYPSMLELLALKERGKKIFFHFRGQEIRTAAGFAAATPFHYVTHPESGKLFKKMPDESKIAALEFITAVADGIFVTDPELQTYVPGSLVVPRVLHAQEWRNVGLPNNETPLVVHAPSRRGVKGTDSILGAVDQLKDKLHFEFRLIEGLPHEEAIALYANADLVIDQLRIGWYGVLAVEAMALGKPTIAYIREDLWRRYGSTLPIINANPDTIASVLEAALTNTDVLKQKSLQSREYFLRVHDAEVVCRSLLDIYRNTPSKVIDWVAVGRFMDRQRKIEIKINSTTSLAPFRRPVKRRIYSLFMYGRENGIVAAGQLLLKYLLRRLHGSK